MQLAGLNKNSPSEPAQRVTEQLLLVYTLQYVAKRLQVRDSYEEPRDRVGEFDEKPSRRRRGVPCQAMTVRSPDIAFKDTCCGAAWLVGRRTEDSAIRVGSRPSERMYGWMAHFGTERRGCLTA
jgi:hypothetical protein